MKSFLLSGNCFCLVLHLSLHVNCASATGSLKIIKSAIYRASIVRVFVNRRVFWGQFVCLKILDNIHTSHTEEFGKLEVETWRGTFLKVG